MSKKSIISTYQPSNAELLKIGRALIKIRSSNKKNMKWPWLEDYIDKPLKKKAANKFVLGAILDYQMNAYVVWENARRYAEDELGDPADLFGVIAKYSEKQWMKKKDKLGLHRYSSAHKRVWRIARVIRNEYDGDARKIWKDSRPSVVIERLLKMKMGDQISPMIVGALIDSKQISTEGESSQVNVKADVHVRRVLGRVAFGSKPLTTEEAVEITRTMYPRKPWLLDMPLYTIGKSNCKAREPNCVDCKLAGVCIYTRQ